MDLDGLKEILDRMGEGTLRTVAVDTREPSPFCHEILNANPYAFLDDAPLEERRTRAVQLRRTLSAEDAQNLGTLDPAAIAQVAEESWPVVRDEHELHDALLTLIVLPPVEEWRQWFEIAGTRRTCVNASIGRIGSRPNAWNRAKPARRGRSRGRSARLDGFDRTRHARGAGRAAVAASGGRRHRAWRKLESEGQILRGRFAVRTKRSFATAASWPAFIA